MKKKSIIFAAILFAMSASGQTCPDENHPHAIDLGLPSGTKWACCNLGAKMPSEVGAYFAFGETEEKEIFDAKNYEMQTYRGKKIIESCDVAHLTLGSPWLMPTTDQIKELIDNCTSEWKSIKDIEGRLFKGKNGNSIFCLLAESR